MPDCSNEQSGIRVGDSPVRFAGGCSPGYDNRYSNPKPQFARLAARHRSYHQQRFGPLGDGVGEWSVLRLV
jgi:hypothetical protein